jgi:hypothetical protein
MEISTSGVAAVAQEMLEKNCEVKVSKVKTKRKGRLTFLQIAKAQVEAMALGEQSILLSVCVCVCVEGKK